MKKFLTVVLVLSAAMSAVAADDFFGDLIASEDLKQEKQLKDERLESQKEAAKILDSAPRRFELKKRQVVDSNVRRNQAEPVLREPAPFGLQWMATLAEIKALRVRLQPVEVKDSPNTYVAFNLPKSVSAFRDVLVSFGDNNALWRIAAYGRFIQDDSAATQGVAEYLKYYELLSQKYGHAQQFFTPAIVNIEKVIENDDGTTTTSLKQAAVEIGTDGFLDKLMSGESTLYSTFDNDNIGVTLALLADGAGQTYIIIDYKNLTAVKQEDKDLYDAL